MLWLCTTWTSLKSPALILERMLDNWSLILLCTQPLLYACIVLPLSCIIFRLKTPSVSSSSKLFPSFWSPCNIFIALYFFQYRPTRTTKSIYKAGVTYIRGTPMFAASSKWWEVWLQKGFGTRLKEEERSGTVPESGFGKESCKSKVSFNFAHRRVKEIPASKQLCHYVTNKLQMMKSQENMSKTKMCVRSKPVKQRVQSSNEKKCKKPPTRLFLSTINLDGSQGYFFGKARLS